MKQAHTLAYDKAFRKFTLGILCIVVTSYIVGGLLYPLPSPINYFFLIGGILTSSPFILVFIVPTVYQKK